MIDRSSVGQAMSLRHMMDRMFEDAFVVPRSGGSRELGRARGGCLRERSGSANGRSVRTLASTRRRSMSRSSGASSRFAGETEAARAHPTAITCYVSTRLGGSLVVCSCRPATRRILPRRATSTGSSAGVPEG